MSSNSSSHNNTNNKNTTVQRVDVFRVSCTGPGDLSGVQALIDSGTLVPADIVAVMGKTEGNGGVNDYTRDFAATSWCHFLCSYLDDCPSPAAVAQRVALVMSGGTEGVLSPHFTVFTRRWLVPAPAPAQPSDQPRDHSSNNNNNDSNNDNKRKRLVIGMAHTRDFWPEEIGRMAQIDATAAATRAAMADAGIVDPLDVHFVQIKCPLVTTGKVQAAAAAATAAPAAVRGGDGLLLPVVTHDPYESMAYSRGASALGVAVALGEIPAAAVLSDAVVLSDRKLFSSCASASAGIELDHNVVLVLGEAVGAASSIRIGHTVMQDAVDATSVRRMLREQFDIDFFDRISNNNDSAQQQQRIINVLAKAEASPNGRVRGERHTMLNDTDITATRHARAVVGGVLASVVGQTALYVSGGAEHQGPAGGGPVAVLVRVDDDS